MTRLQRPGLREAQGDSSTPLTRASSSGRLRAGARIAAFALCVVLFAAPAAADTYRSDKAGHPLRIAAYVVYPVGVIIETLVLRPFHWLGSHEPLKTLFGHTD